MCIYLLVFLMIERRNRVACEDHRHRQCNGCPKAAFALLGFAFGVHFGLPFLLHPDLDGL